MLTLYFATLSVYIGQECSFFSTVWGNDGSSTSTASTQIRNSSPVELSTSKLLDATMDGYGQTYSLWDKTTAKARGSTLPTTSNRLHYTLVHFIATENDLGLKPLTFSQIK